MSSNSLSENTPSNTLTSNSKSEIAKIIKEFIGSSVPVAVPEQTASIITGIAVQTLRNHRSRHTGIPYVRNGRSIRYLVVDLLNHLLANRIDPEELTGNRQDRSLLIKQVLSDLQP